MRKIKDNLLPLSYMISIPILHVFYAILNNPDRGAYSLMTDLDQLTPFLKEFIVPYILWYPFIFITLAYLCIKDKKTYYRTLIAMDIGLIICYITYYFFQTTVPRPQLVGDDIFTKMVDVIYKKDQPYNCFPSIHVLTSYMMMKGINNSQCRTILNSTIINVSGSIIIASTVFVKQHVILDVVSAIIISDVIFKLVCTMNWERILLWLESQYSSWMMKKKLEI